MDYFKRISRIVLIALPLSLILAIGILFTQQMIKAKISHEKRVSTNPLSFLSLFNYSDGLDKGGGKYYKFKSKPQKREYYPITKERKKNHSNHLTQSIWLTLYILVFILLSIIAFIFFKKRKKKNQSVLPMKYNDQLLNTRNSNKKETNLTVQSFLPTEQIRIMLIEWEKQLTKTQQRRTYETIQQWFERIGKDAEFVPFYEKVRYGKKQILNEEIEIARKFLNYN